ncbi:MAG: hypothetical protein MUO19_06790 [Dehalococcoidales bacterium]|nr:hypothetical protein [Dehalococcoidales bacterium]
MFKVKATVTGYGKNEHLYPCHFRYSIGDEIVYDGETIHGRVCPSIMPALGKAFNELFASGGRHREGQAAGSYFPFWHSPLSVYDATYKKYDGVGFRPTPERPEEDYVFVPDETLFDNPPKGEYFIGKGTEKQNLTVTCNDQHTLVQLRVEAFDLADRGDALPYYRRSMSILAKVAGKPGIGMEAILGEFTRDEIIEIYPIIGQKIVAILVGELELVAYVTVTGDAVTVTEEGKRKLEDYKADLTPEERRALNL